MTAEDLLARNATYRLFARLGRAPASREVAAEAGTTDSAIRSAWRRLHEQHALVLNTAGTELRMANPFSAVPTAHRVRAGGRWWYANCAWDAFGICAALGSDGAVETSCPDCGEAIAASVVEGRAQPESLLFHCLVPASRWWEDIGFT